ncbi:hypothetical protein M7I_2780 [Glarea lozoyensis 74030]|uniref:Uncharacterized protein n=1 Tax=Glarea lozoyensis (strain ATCC 74030 / MF5533) TaxID=1104152 RepID=H0EJQ0_GLAL7|nr:hypothetical protein M7I_2780 [Glarea lozoyensis 74030]
MYGFTFAATLSGQQFALQKFDALKKFMKIGRLAASSFAASGSVCVKKRKHCLHQTAKVPAPCQGHWECTMYQNKAIFRNIIMAFRLYPNIEEPNAVFELELHTDGLAANGRKSFVIGW